MVRAQSTFACLQLLCLLLAPLLAKAAIDEHLVTHLPGFKGPLPTRHWSGYLKTPHPNGTVNTHYWLVENSQNLSDAPTLLWQQGGPGGSSLIGLFTENGPLTANDFSFTTSDHNETGVPSIFLNPNSWHQIPANVLYLEHPAPTGFSFCDPGPCDWDDDSQSNTSYNVIVEFFRNYPELKHNRFLASGESYAGVLVPTLAAQILKHKTDQNRHVAPWSLEGFALGNDCPGNKVYTCTPYSGWIGTQVAVDFRFRHGMISEELYAQINDVCKGQWGTFAAPTEACAKILEDPVRPCMSHAGDTYQMGGGYYLYDTCGQDLLALGPDNKPIQDMELAMKDIHKVTAAILAVGDAGDDVPTPVGYLNNAGTYACGQERASAVWLNLPSVRRAIHVQSQAEGGSFHFSTGLNYTFTAANLVPLYASTLLKNFRVLQYSGDADPCVPYVGTERWIESLNLTVATPWKPWAIPTQGVAGYSTVYDVPGASHKFTFATVRDAGHMVPRYKGAQALHMITKFLKDEPL